MIEPSTYVLSELLDEANRLREQIPDLADTDPFTDRTVYYYVQQGLLPRASRRRGPGTTYPQDFVYRLLFIRRLQKEDGLTLAHIRTVLSAVTDETMRRVALGEEPLELRMNASPEEVESRLASKEQVIPLISPMRVADSEPRPGTDKNIKRNIKNNLGAEDHIDDPGELFSHSLNYFMSHKEPTCLEEPPPTEHQFKIGDDATLEVRKPLTQLQRKRIEQTVALLQSILEDDD